MSPSMPITPAFSRAFSSGLLAVVVSSTRQARSTPSPHSIAHPPRQPHNPLHLRNNCRAPPSLLPLIAIQVLLLSISSLLSAALSLILGLPGLRQSWGGKINIGRRSHSFDLDSWLLVLRQDRGLCNWRWLIDHNIPRQRLPVLVGSGGRTSA